ncbi:MAG: hypothetical protein WDM92_02420 [Caulobacteraceae bacterium]
MRAVIPSGTGGGTGRPFGLRLTAVDIVIIAGAAMLVAFISAIGGSALGL